jgi:hypothetical protein
VRNQPDQLSAEEFRLRSSKKHKQAKVNFFYFDVFAGPIGVIADLADFGSEKHDVT